jgi:hypothetical protein
VPSTNWRRCCRRRSRRSTRSSTRASCLELLFRHAERYEGLDPTTSARDWQRREQEVREPFLKITARDVRKTGARGETEVLGAWGLAAQTALDHFRWMNLHGNYDAAHDHRGPHLAR